MKKIVVIGGGTGNFAVLSGLKKYPCQLTAIVSMSDSGGHSGKLRDELGVLPPGDVRACLVALADDNKAGLVRDLFNYRFQSGSQGGASIGNLLLTALSDLLGGFDKGVRAAHHLLDIKGYVVPVTLQKTDLLAELEDGTILYGEMAIDLPRENGHLKIKRIWLQPKVEANEAAIKAILEADIIIFGPGDLYTSIMPNLCVGGVVEALRKSKAKLIGNVNIMTKHGETDGFGVDDFVSTLEGGLPRQLNYIIYNNKKIPQTLLRKYKKQNALPVKAHLKKANWIGTDILSTAGDLARHDPDKLAKTIFSLL